MDSVTWPSRFQIQSLMNASEVCEETVSIDWDMNRVDGGRGFSGTIEVTLEPYAAVEIEINAETVPSIITPKS